MLLLYRCNRSGILTAGPIEGLEQTGEWKIDAFTDLLDWTLLPFKKYKSAELQTQALETYQSHPQVTQLVTLMNIIGDLSEGLAAPLGELHMQAISNGHNGQYSTPTPICEMMTMYSFNTK